MPINGSPVCDVMSGITGNMWYCVCFRFRRRFTCWVTCVGRNTSRQLQTTTLGGNLLDKK